MRDPIEAGLGNLIDSLDYWHNRTFNTAVDRGASWEQAGHIADSVDERRTWVQFAEGNDPDVPYGDWLVGSGDPLTSDPSTSFVDYLKPIVRDLESQSDIPLIPRTLLYQARPPDPGSYDPSTFASLPGHERIPENFRFQLQDKNRVVELYDPGNEDFNVRATEQIQDAATEYLQPLIDTVPVKPEARAEIKNTMRGAIGGEYGGLHWPHRGAVMGGTVTAILSGGETRRRDSRVASTIVHEGAHEHEELHNVMSYRGPPDRPWERTVRPEWVEAFRANGGQWLIDMADGEFENEGWKLRGFHRHFINGKNAEGEDTDGVENFAEQYGSLASLAYELNPDDPLSVLRKHNPALVRFYEGFFKASDPIVQEDDQSADEVTDLRSHDYAVNERIQFEQDRQHQAEINTIYPV